MTVDDSKKKKFPSRAAWRKIEGELLTRERGSSKRYLEREMLVEQIIYLLTSSLTWGVAAQIDPRDWEGWQILGEAHY